MMAVPAVVMAVSAMMMIMGFLPVPTTLVGAVVVRVFPAVAMGRHAPTLTRITP
jgi:hypothetical protein